MLCSICESVAKIKEQCENKSSVHASHTHIESTEWMLGTQIEHHNKQNVPLTLCTILAVFTGFWKQRRLGRRKNS